VNGLEDPYEFEPVGVGGCVVSDPRFSVRSGGCVSLLSSGKSSGESAFMDASATGGDVFVITADKLVSQDFDESRDIYDVHECLDSAPCFPPARVAPPACTPADACRAAPTPQRLVFGSPASETFNGVGNVTASMPVVAVKRRTSGSVGSRKLDSALRRCHKLKQRSARHVCEARARARHVSGSGKRRKGGRQK